MKHFASFGLFLIVVCAVFHVSEAAYDYTEALHKSLLFYEAQRAGTLPASNRIPWRRSAMEGDKGNNGEDLSGGYFDAGDHVKFGLPMAWTITVLAWGVLENKNRYQTAGEYNEALAAIKWGTDYFIKCHVSQNEFYGQVGDGHADHSFWGRPEEYTGARPAFKLSTSKPGTEVACETAAALAAASIVFKDNGDTAYATVLLSHARQLYDFGNQYRGTYHDSIPNAATFYRSWSGFGDELAWSALWLHWATGESSYMSDFETFFSQFNLNGGYAFSWDEKHYGLQILAAILTGDSSRYNTAIQSMNGWLPGGGIQYTPMGLAWRMQWGPNRYAGNMAFLAFTLSKHLVDTNQQSNKAAEFSTFAKSQVDYFLGDGPRSFVVGFGNNPPHSVHHRGASCPNRPASCSNAQLNSPDPNPQILYGALAGGPGENDDFADNRQDYIKNEVAIDYNAGFQGAVAFLVSGPPTNPTTTSSSTATSTSASTSTSTSTASNSACSATATSTITSTMPGSTTTAFRTITRSVTSTAVSTSTATKTVSVTTTQAPTTVTATQTHTITRTEFPSATDSVTITETQTVEVTKTSTCSIGEATAVSIGTSTPSTTSSVSTSAPTSTNTGDTSLPSRTCKFHFSNPRYPTLSSGELSSDKAISSPDDIVLASDGTTPVQNCQSKSHVMYFDETQGRWIKSDLLGNVLYMSGNVINRRVVQSNDRDEFKQLRWKWLKMSMSCQLPDQNEVNCVEFRVSP